MPPSSSTTSSPLLDSMSEDLQHEVSARFNMSLPAYFSQISQLTARPMMETTKGVSANVVGYRLGNETLAPPPARNESGAAGEVEISGGIVWTLVAPLILLAFLVVIGVCVVCLWRLRDRRRQNDVTESDDEERGRDATTGEMEMRELGSGALSPGSRYSESSGRPLPPGQDTRGQGQRGDVAPRAPPHSRQRPPCFPGGGDLSEKEGVQLGNHGDGYYGDGPTTPDAARGESGLDFSPHARGPYPHHYHPHYNHQHQQQQGYGRESGEDLTQLKAAGVVTQDRRTWLSEEQRLEMDRALKGQLDPDLYCSSCQLQAHHSHQKNQQQNQHQQHSHMGHYHPHPHTHHPPPHPHHQQHQRVHHNPDTHLQSPLHQLRQQQKHQVSTLERHATSRPPEEAVYSDSAATTTTATTTKKLPYCQQCADRHDDGSKKKQQPRKNGQHQQRPSEDAQHPHHHPHHHHLYQQQHQQGWRSHEHHLHRAHKKRLQESDLLHLTSHSLDSHLHLIPKYQPPVPEHQARTTATQLLLLQQRGEEVGGEGAGSGPQAHDPLLPSRDLDPDDDLDPGGGQGHHLQPTFTRGRSFHGTLNPLFVADSDEDEATGGGGGGGGGDGGGGGGGGGLSEDDDGAVKGRDGEGPVEGQRRSGRGGRVGELRQARIINSTSMPSPGGGREPGRRGGAGRPLTRKALLPEEGPDVSSIRLLNSTSQAWRCSHRLLPTTISSSETPSYNTSITTDHTDNDSDDADEDEGSDDSDDDAVDETLSLPSSISRFHASRVQQFPTLLPDALYPLTSTKAASSPSLALQHSAGDSVTGARQDGGTVLDMLDHYSDNTSTQPNVGSSLTSGANSDSRGSHPSLPTPHPWSHTPLPPELNRPPHYPLSSQQLHPHPHLQQQLPGSRGSFHDGDVDRGANPARQQRQKTGARRTERTPAREVSEQAGGAYSARGAQGSNPRGGSAGEAERSYARGFGEVPGGAAERYLLPASDADLTDSYLKAASKTSEHTSLDMPASAAELRRSRVFRADGERRSDKGSAKGGGGGGTGSKKQGYFLIPKGSQEDVHREHHRRYQPLQAMPESSNIREEATSRLRINPSRPADHAYYSPAPGQGRVNLAAERLPLSIKTPTLSETSLTALGIHHAHAHHPASPARYEDAGRIPDRGSTRGPQEQHPAKLYSCRFMDRKPAHHYSPGREKKRTSKAIIPSRRGKENTHRQHEPPAQQLTDQKQRHAARLFPELLSVKSSNLSASFPNVYVHHEESGSGNVRQSQRPSLGLFRSHKSCASRMKRAKSQEGHAYVNMGSSFFDDPPQTPGRHDFHFDAAKLGLAQDRRSCFIYQDQSETNTLSGRGYRPESVPCADPPPSPQIVDSKRSERRNRPGAADTESPVEQGQKQNQQEKHEPRRENLYSARSDSEILADILDSFPPSANQLHGSGVYGTDDVNDRKDVDEVNNKRGEYEALLGGFRSEVTIPTAFADELFGIWSLSPELDDDISPSRPRSPLMTPLKEEAVRANHRFIWGHSGSHSGGSTSTSSFALSRSQQPLQGKLLLEEVGDEEEEEAGHDRRRGVRGAQSGRQMEFDNGTEGTKGRDVGGTRRSTRRKTEVAGVEAEGAKGRAAGPRSIRQLEFGHEAEERKRGGGAPRLAAKAEGVEGQEKTGKQAKDLSNESDDYVRMGGRYSSLFITTTTGAATKPTAKSPTDTAPTIAATAAITTAATMTTPPSTTTTSNNVLNHSRSSSGGGGHQRSSSAQMSVSDTTSSDVAPSTPTHVDTDPELMESYKGLPLSNLNLSHLYVISGDPDQEEDLNNNRFSGLAFESATTDPVGVSLVGGTTPGVIPPPPPAAAATADAVVVASPSSGQVVKAGSEPASGQTQVRDSAPAALAVVLGERNYWL